MKKLILLFITSALVCQIASAQDNRVHTQRILTDPSKGFKVEIGSAGNTAVEPTAESVRIRCNTGVNRNQLACHGCCRHRLLFKSPQTRLKRLLPGGVLNTSGFHCMALQMFRYGKVPLTILTTEESVDMTEGGSRIANG